MSSAKPGSVKAVSSAESGSRNGDAHIRKRIADLTAMLAKLDEHAAALAKERARVAAELSKLLGKVDPGASVARRPGEPSSAVPKPTDAPDAPPAATKAATKDARGRCAAMCIEDIDRIAKVWSSSVACIALGDACAALLFDSAPPVFSTNFEQKCPQLHAQLASRAEDMPRAVFLAIGTEERFYTRFADGKQEWVASEECTADVKLKPVSKLAFGRDWEDYFILYKDGSCKWAGIPPKLAAKLQQLTPKSPPVANVTLGPDGEWCARRGAAPAARPPRTRPARYPARPPPGSSASPTARGRWAAARTRSATRWRRLSRRARRSS